MTSIIQTCQHKPVRVDLQRVKVGLAGVRPLCTIQLQAQLGQGARLGYEPKPLSEDSE